MSYDKILEKMELGSDSAETDKILDSAFIETRQYLDALSGSRRLILGRKGTGKSAIYRMLSKRLDSDTQTVVQITPTKIFWGNLARKNKETNIEDLINLWEFSIYCRIFLDARLQGIISNPRPLKDIDSLLKSILGVSRLKGTRLDRSQSETILTKIWNATTKLFGDSVTTAEVGNSIFKIKIDLVSSNGIVPDEIVSEFRYRLNEIVPVGYKIRVLFDQLDEYWDGSEQSQKMMTSLMSAILNIIEQFPERIIPTVFLRNDIWELLHFVRKDRYPMYESILTWNDDNLANLVCQRIRSSTGIEGNDKDVWSHVFGQDNTPASRTSPGYILNRTFRRPRDVLYFVRECVTEARNSGEGKISPASVMAVERSSNSRTLTENLVNEVVVNYPFIRDILEALKGHRHVISRRTLATIFKSAKEVYSGTFPKRCTNAWLEEWLFELCVLGVSNTESPTTSDTIYRYMESRTDIKCYKYFIVHPGLRAYLGTTNRTNRSQ